METYCDSNYYDFLFKIVLVGDSGVGKSNLLSRFINNEFYDNSSTTIGVEFQTKSMQIQGQLVKSQIWDTAGQERYRALTSAYYRNAVGALLIYDITDKRSFENLKKWVSELRNHSQQNTVLILVGNKCDLTTQRAVKIEDAERYAAHESKISQTLNLLDMAFIETSALNAKNVKVAFTNLINEIYKLARMGKFSDQNGTMDGMFGNNISSTADGSKPRSGQGFGKGNNLSISGINNNKSIILSSQDHKNKQSILEQGKKNNNKCCIK
ncbi:ras-related protein rab-11b [Stylonychia lemnae]|uniref:Ras-related protein rab-11b n=1 Tax=Stylonychia lemnae TaxID=5949 RepID=A0A078AMV4_STYLE|nr:ras-related protein rab-11b [Stylonychia lemnae]|eukprot:CDW82707.1 ras-related protein rab-11b [Stylonychia lemnae]